MKDTAYRSKQKVRVDLQLQDGSVLDGFVFCSQGERVSDVLNDAREFIPFETHTNDIMMLRKSVIASILAREVDKKKKSSSDPYAILGVSKDADRNDVKHAYHEKVRLYHPDKLNSLDLPDDMTIYANDMLARINSAYDLINRKLDAQNPNEKPGENPDANKASA